MLLKKRLFLLLMLLSLLGLAAFFIYSKDKTIESSWQENTVEPFKWWYQINWQKQAIGWASLELKRSETFITIIEEDFITGRVQSERMEFKFKRQLQFLNKEPYQLHSIVINSQEPSLNIHKLGLNQQEFRVTETRNNKESTASFPKVEYYLKDYLAKFLWANRKGSEPIMISKEFNNDDYGLHYSRYERYAVNDLGLTLARHQLQNTDQLNDSYQSQTSILSFAENGKLVREEKPNGMSYVSSQGKVSLNPEMQRDLYLSSGIKVNQALGNVGDILSLSLQIIPNEAIDRFSSHPAIIIENNLLRLNDGYHYTGAYQAKLAEAHPRAKGLAQTLTIGAGSDEQKVKTLIKYVHDELSYQTLPSSFEIDDILDSKIGDCTEHALLLTEMLNGIGIPARQVSGLIYLGDAKQQFGGHVWVEVFLNQQWQAIDPTWNLFKVTATHLPLQIGAVKTPEILKNTSSLEFKVQNIAYK